MRGITDNKMFLKDGSTANASQISATLIHFYEMTGMITYVSPAYKLSMRVQNINTTKPL
jgi:hypothetical protein